MQIKNVDYHRNGSSGEGFYVGIVTNPFDAEGTEGEDFLVITLDDEHRLDDEGNEVVTDRSEFTFVLRIEDIVAGRLELAWRGDIAASICRRPLIAERRRRWD